MKCSVFIATSIDGYIADPDGGVAWLDSVGNRDSNLGDQADMGFFDFFNSVDCLILGRKSMEVVAAMDLTPEQWPYGETRIIVLSKTLREPPKSLPGKIEIYSGDLLDLTATLEKEGHRHAYVDGGSTICSFLNLKLIDEIILTRAPVILGAGIPLFSGLEQQIRLEQAQAIVFANDFMQTRYRVRYD